MAQTNIDLNEQLLKEGIKLTGFTSKKKLVNFALEELINRQKRKDILALMGSHCWEGNLNQTRRSRF